MSKLKLETTTKIFQACVISLMSFIAFHVYQNSINGAVFQQILVTHELRIKQNEDRIFQFLTNPKKQVSLPIPAPLIQIKERRHTARIVH